MTRPPLFIAADVMTPRSVTVSPSTPLFDAIDLLLEHGLAAIPAVDEAGAVQGILTEQDCLKLVAAATYDDEPRDGLLEVARYLSAAPSVPHDLEIYQVIGHFDDPTVWSVVVEEDGALVGVISRRDLLRGILAMREEVVTLLGREHHDHLTPRSFFGATRHDASEVASRLKR